MTFRLDFMCVGAAKAGTTWLCHNLRQHPRIFICADKELHYFNQYLPENPQKINPNYQKSLTWYHQFFEAATPNQLTADFSTSYLKYPNCAKDLFTYNPSLKIIMILREPIERVLSHYYFLIQRNIIPKQDLTQAIKTHPHILENSLYAKQLKNYQTFFPKEQIKILWYKEIKQTPQTLINEVTNFLEIEQFTPKDLKKKINVTQYTPQNSLSKIIQKAKKIAGLNTEEKQNRNRKEILTNPLKTELKAYFQEDICTLEKMLNKDLSLWKV